MTDYVVRKLDSRGRPNGKPLILKGYVEAPSYPIRIQRLDENAAAVGEPLVYSTSTPVEIDFTPSDMTDVTACSMCKSYSITWSFEPLELSRRLDRRLDRAIRRAWRWLDRKVRR